MNAILSLIINVLFISVAICQTSKEIAFDETSFNFGEIQESEGSVEHEFTFTNLSNHLIKILGVKASCGCTSTGWTRQEVGPGEKGFVKAMYNPRNRPGSFNKSLTVTTSAVQNTIVLRIQGKVIPKIKTIEEQLPALIGDLRFKYNSFNLGKILTNESQTVEFAVFNDSKEQPITFQSEYEAPEYIKLEFQPETLNPRDHGSIKVNFDGKARNDLGFLVDNIVFYTSEKEDNRKEFQVYTTVEEYFPTMTAEELANAPKLKLEKNLIDFGRVDNSEKISIELKIINEGKSDLYIRKIKSTCGCTTTNPDKEVLKPGESGSLNVTFDPRGRSGSQHKLITIFSNDPRASAQRLTVKAFVNN